MIPAWPPDGKRILFNILRGVGANANYDVFVMNADGSNQSNLTNAPAIDGSGDWQPLKKKKKKKRR